MNAILTEIRDFADKAHGDQKRKYTPDRYIVHPVRVMELCEKYTDDVSILAAALLHDILEDTPTSKAEIGSFLSKRLTPQQVDKTLALVSELTDVYVKKDYPQWNRKTRKEKELVRLTSISKDAQTIKYADIIDNCIDVVKHDKGFAKRFLYECKEILEHLSSGDRELHHKAVETLNQEINSIKG